MSFTGLYGRWDSDLSQWANVQFNEPLADLISDANGDIVIDESVFTHVTQEEVCVPLVDGDLEAEQCSEYTERMLQEGDPFCGEFEVPPAIADWVKTDIGNVKWNGADGGRRADAGTGEAVAYGNNADSIQIGNRYYDWTKQQLDEEQPPAQTPGGIITDNSYHIVHEYGPTGVCGYGTIARNSDGADGQTGAGSTPQECPAMYGAP